MAQFCWRTTLIHQGKEKKYINADRHIPLPIFHTISRPYQEKNKEKGTGIDYWSLFPVHPLDFLMPTTCLPISFTRFHFTHNFNKTPYVLEYVMILNWVLSRRVFNHILSTLSKPNFADALIQLPGKWYAGKLSTISWMSPGSCLSFKYSGVPMKSALC